MDAAPEQSDLSGDPAPSQARQMIMRIGIQGKLVLSFMFLLLASLVGSWWLFADETRSVTASLMGAKAVEISQTLAMASQTALGEKNFGELGRIGKDLLKYRDVMTVAFFDDAGKPLSVSCKDLDASQNSDFLPDLHNNIQHLMQVHHRSSKVLGEYAEVTAPVLSYTGKQEGSRLVGYVMVNISEADQKEYIRRVNVILAIVGGLVLLASLPVVSILVHRIFMPIRQLVGATDRIAAGDLETQVAIDRPDLIGILARSFNEMAKKVKSQREALAGANINLEKKVHQRTSQLEAANNRLSREIAEKEDFLRAVSHDLNAPLRNISGMATMLLMKHRDKFDEDVVHRLERIQKNVQVETDLIGELLELSRIKTRRQKMEPTDLNEMVLDIADVFEDDLKSKSIELLIDNPLPVLNCEKARLRQVFQNLIDNAIKYMGDGPLRQIRISSRTAGGEVEFCVRDTGIGIESEDIDKVFCVFRRGKGAQVQSVAGKGIGLSSVKSIIETYNGTIWVESQPQQGTKFTFTINGRHLLDQASPPPKSPMDYKEEAVEV